MRLIKARVQGYRSIIDSGYFDIEQMKTILVGPNEAGKTALLQALQKLNPPEGVSGFDSLRDYPRSKYDEDIECGKIDPAKFTVVEGHFVLSDEERGDVPTEYCDLVYVYGKYLNNNSWHGLENVPAQLQYNAVDKDISRILSHIEINADSEQPQAKSQANSVKIRQDITTVTQKLSPTTTITKSIATSIMEWLDTNFTYVAEGSQEEERYDKLKNALSTVLLRGEILERCEKLLPKFILFNNYFRVHPSIHLANLAQRIERKLLDDEQYDYGNICLLKFLGFTAMELSQAGAVTLTNNAISETQYKDTIDKRDYRLNAASVRLTKEICQVWNPNTDKGEASKLKIKADGQYLKVVVEDELGVEVELSAKCRERSRYICCLGFSWFSLRSTRGQQCCRNLVEFMSVLGS
jgi:energy-coupling factor transporter ATP-binding protein EcfA2